MKKKLHEKIEMIRHYPEVEPIEGDHFIVRREDEPPKLLTLDTIEKAFFTSREPQRLFPGNPIRFTWQPLSGLLSWDIGPGFRAGKLIAEIPLEAKKEHVLEIDSVLRALREDVGLGRPPGPPKEKKRKRRVSPREADQAYEMNSRGSLWREIAKKLWPSMTPAELRSDKTRLRVRYLVERGGRRARKKSGTKS